MLRLAARFGGVLVGLVLAIGAVLLLEAWRRPPAPPVPRLLPDCDGALRELVIHYVKDSAPINGAIYRRFLGDLPNDVTVHVVVPDEAAWKELRSELGEVPVRLRPVIVDHAMTCWSRDRWLALATGGKTELLLPALEDSAESWPARAGDAATGKDLAATLAEVTASHSYWDFDGGDFVADDTTVFVATAVWHKNLGHRGASVAELVERLEQRLGRRVVLFERSPDHHAGMFLMTAGEKRVVVGDPSLARELRGEQDWTPCGDDFSDETQALFDAVAERCRREGYAVTRVPVVPGKDGRTWLSYVNGMIDQRDGERICYLPVFEHAPRLNALAQRTWESLDYRVVEVDCTDSYACFGTLRCLVNVLRRG